MTDDKEAIIDTSTWTKFYTVEHQVFDFKIGDISTYR